MRAEKCELAECGLRACERRTQSHGGRPKCIPDKRRPWSCEKRVFFLNWPKRRPRTLEKLNLRQRCAGLDNRPADESPRIGCARGFQAVKKPRRAREDRSPFALEPSPIAYAAGRFFSAGAIHSCAAPGNPVLQAPLPGKPAIETQLSSYLQTAPRPL